MMEDTVTKGPFAVVRRDGSRREVTGWRGASVGVHEVAPQVWSVTHLPTGMRANSDPLCCEADALTVLNLLDGLLPATGEWNVRPDPVTYRRAYYLVLGWMFANKYYDYE